MGKEEVGLRLAGALWWFWRSQGRFRQGVQYLEAALAREGAQGATAARAKALKLAGDLANLQGDYASARALNEDSLANCRELGDEVGIGHTLNSLGHVAREQGDYEAARTLYEQSLSMKREFGDKGNIAHLLNDLGLVAQYQGDHALAGALYEQG